MLIGGGGERKTLRIVAEHADIWHSFSDVDTLLHKSEVLAQHCAELGRDAGEIERSVGVNGSPGTDAQQLRAAGASLFTVGADGPDYDLGPLRDWLTWRDEQNAQARAGRGGGSGI